jgi:hypothetical protein
VRRRAAIALAVLLFAGSARADDAETEKLITRGVALREQGKDDEALAVFKKALDKSPGSARARAQVALAEQALGMWVAADADLALALAADDPWIAKNRAALDGALAVVRRHVGSLEVRGPEGAEVFLDGVRLGTLPQTTPFRAEAGRRALEVRAKGFHSTERTIEVPPNGVARETVTLEPLSESAQAPSGKGSAPGVVVVTPDTGASQRLLGWIFVGTGGALLVAGGAALLVRQGYVNDYNDNCNGVGATQTPDCQSKIDSSHTWMTVSLVGLIAGGAFAIGGAALVLTSPSSDAPKVACAPALGGASCRMTF